VIVTHCNTLQHTQETVKQKGIPVVTVTHCNTLHCETHCNTLQHTQETPKQKGNPLVFVTHCHTLQHTSESLKQKGHPEATAAPCNILQHTATHENTLQHMKRPDRRDSNSVLQGRVVQCVEVCFSVLRCNLLHTTEETLTHEDDPLDNSPQYTTVHHTANTLFQNTTI